MNEAIKIINKMVKDGLIDNYAIGGAVAAIYYLEPIDTADLERRHGLTKKWNENEYRFKP